MQKPNTDSTASINLSGIASRLHLTYGKLWYSWDYAQKHGIRAFPRHHKIDGTTARNRREAITFPRSDWLEWEDYHQLGTFRGLKKWRDKYELPLRLNESKYNAGLGATSDDALPDRSRFLPLVFPLNFKYDRPLRAHSERKIIAQWIRDLRSGRLLPHQLYAGLLFLGGPSVGFGYVERENARSGMLPFGGPRSMRDEDWDEFLTEINAYFGTRATSPKSKVELTSIGVKYPKYDREKSVTLILPPACLGADRDKLAEFLQVMSEFKNHLNPNAINYTKELHHRAALVDAFVTSYTLEVRQVEVDHPLRPYLQFIVAGLLGENDEYSEPVSYRLPPPKREL